MATICFGVELLNIKLPFNSDHNFEVLIVATFVRLVSSQNHKFTSTGMDRLDIDENT